MKLKILIFISILLIYNLFSSTAQNIRKIYLIFVTHEGMSELTYTNDDFENGRFKETTYLPEDFDANSYSPEDLRCIRHYKDRIKNNVMVINPITRFAVSIIDIWKYGIHPVWIERNDDFLLISDSDNNITIKKINSYDYKVISSGKDNLICNMTVDASGTNLFYTFLNNKKPCMGIIDIKSASCVKTIPLLDIKNDEYYYPSSIVAGKSKIYITLATKNGGELLFINNKDYSVNKLLNLEKIPTDIAITKDGMKIYIVNKNADNISVISLFLKKITCVISVGAEPAKIAISPDGTRAIVSNSKSNNVSIIDVKTDTVITTIPTGKNPIGVAISPDSKTAFVANYSSDYVTMIDLTENKSIGNTIPFPGGHPFDIVVK